MPEKTDPLTELRSLVNEVQSSEEVLRAALQKLATALREICDGTSLYCSGCQCDLEEYAPDEWNYGFFHFNGFALLVHYRSRDDDLIDAHSPPDPYGPTYRYFGVGNAPIQWLKALVKGHSLQTLLTSIGDDMRRQIAELHDSRRTIERIAANPSLAIASSFEQAAEGLGYARAIEDWKKAQSAIASDPENAITLACSLIESVSKHVLNDIGTPLPADQSVVPLFKTAAKALGLAPKDQADADLKGLCGAIATVAQQVGTLRTHSGDAHGKGPDHLSLSQSEARLAVNSAGSVATFLMERWMTRKETTSGT
jgi:uncharacterized protein YjeT (DUF2065 family)